MAYRVEISDPAARDIDEALSYILRDSLSAAKSWHSDLTELLDLIADLPTRFGAMAEAKSLKLPYRSVMHHSHRVIYRIDDEAQVVYVVRVYHSARRSLRRRDLG